MEEEKKTKNILLNKTRERQIDRVYLNVPYKQKDIAKGLGAWWDPQKKSWYAPKKCNGKYFRNVNYDKLKQLFS